MMPNVHAAGRPQRRVRPRTNVVGRIRRARTAPPRIAPNAESSRKLRSWNFLSSSFIPQYNPLPLSAVPGNRIKGWERCLIQWINASFHIGRNGGLVNLSDCSHFSCGAIRGGAAIAPYECALPRWPTNVVGGITNPAALRLIINVTS